jgi:hypothetical protein
MRRRVRLGIAYDSGDSAARANHQIPWVRNGGELLRVMGVAGHH